MFVLYVVVGTPREMRFFGWKLFKKDSKLSTAAKYALYWLVLFAGVFFGEVLFGEGEEFAILCHLDVVPAGGGGLLAGVAFAVKSVNPKVRVIGVQAEGAPAIALSFREKRHISTDSVYTIADGIAVKNPGDITMKLIDEYADDVMTVSDGDIASAIIHLIERTKLIVEPAGATSLALLLSGKLNVRGKKVACLLSGGNIDVSTIGKIIDRGLVSRGRKIEFSIQLQDKPGMLEKVSHILAAENANVISITYDRMSADLELGETILHLGCEVGGKEHAARVAAALTSSGLKVLDNGRKSR